MWSLFLPFITASNERKSEKSEGGIISLSLSLSTDHKGKVKESIGKGTWYFEGGAWAFDPKAFYKLPSPPIYKVLRVCGPYAVTPLNRTLVFESYLGIGLDPQYFPSISITIPSNVYGTQMCQNAWSKMILKPNRVILERCPSPNGVVGYSIPVVKSSLYLPG